MNFKNFMLGRTKSDAVRGASEARDQAVVSYSAEANERSNKEMRRPCASLCYFGIYQPVAPRDKVYLDGLKERGLKVIECVDNSSGFLKFFRLWKKHRALAGRYDILWVGYLSTMVVPLAWLISSKKIVFNALDSWYDRSVIDREMYSRFSPKAWVVWLFDFIAFHLSDVVLLESEQQKIFISKKFFVNTSKLKVVFTGVNEAIFYPDLSVPKAKEFTVVFRGMFLPATGVEFVFEAAKILKDKGVKFIIIGWGEPILTKVKKMILESNLTNVTLITNFLSPDKLRETMLSANVMLGQFGNHKRLDRTIQNKNFEALALGMPLITRDSMSNRELLVDGVNCLFVPPENPKAIAEKIIAAKNFQSTLKSLPLSGRATFESRCSREVLVEVIQNILKTI